MGSIVAIVRIGEGGNDLALAQACARMAVSQIA
jgi:hypothetical protein